MSRQAGADDSSEATHPLATLADADTFGLCDALDAMRGAIETEPTMPTAQTYPGKVAAVDKRIETLLKRSQ